MEDPVTIRLPSFVQREDLIVKMLSGEAKCQPHQEETMELDSNANHMMEQEMC